MFYAEWNIARSNNSAHKVAGQVPLFTLVDGVLFFVNSKYRDRKQCVVTKHLRQTIIEEHHSSPNWCLCVTKWSLRKLN